MDPSKHPLEYPIKTSEWIDRLKVTMGQNVEKNLTEWNITDNIYVICMEHFCLALHLNVNAWALVRLCPACLGLSSHRYQHISRWYTAAAAQEHEVAGSMLPLARLWQCALGQGTSPECALSRFLSKLVPGRTVMDCYGLCDRSVSCTYIYMAAVLYAPGVLERGSHDGESGRPEEQCHILWLAGVCYMVFGMNLVGVTTISWNCPWGEL